MRVKCIDASDKDMHSFVKKMDKEYIVLKLYIDLQDNKITYRLMTSDDGTPAIFNAKNFEIVNNFIPSGWVIKFYSKTMFSLSPAAWSADNFWVDFFDGEPYARKIYEQELAKIIEEDENICVTRADVPDLLEFICDFGCDGNLDENSVQTLEFLDQDNKIALFSHSLLDRSFRLRIFEGDVEIFSISNKHLLEARIHKDQNLIKIKYGKRRDVYNIDFVVWPVFKVSFSDFE